MEKTLVCGVGISEAGKYKRSVSGKMTREYDLWKHMLHRCYYQNALKRNPSYGQCTVSENFKNFQYFAEWCNSQPEFFLGGQLDKDIKIKGNLEYSADTCEFVPKEINLCFIKANSIRGEFPIGVSFEVDRGKFASQVCVGSGKYVRKRDFTDPHSAFLFYKAKKEQYIKQLADKHKNVISEALYKAMMYYEVEITD